MSKYIIELGEDANMVQVISVTQSGNAYIDSTVYVEYLEQLNSDYINENFGELQDEAYQRGFEDGKAVNDKGCEGCMYQDNTIEHHPCGVCCNAYNNRWKAKQTDDKIEVGDEVEVLNSGNKYLVAWIAGTSLCGFAHDGVTCRLQPSDVRKTGRHFDIASILEDMRND